ncbi:GNAT family N-acetyltransferase [Succinatimonas hippei]|uniref:GNAT family N-acetyltransferase n=1 Tax=Succinatimonas hippei TaxID=626938 RepID=UPI0023F8BA87|nr:GNAT family N-acetyltransferase [Succinatimonas hippei]
MIEIVDVSYNDLVDMARIEAASIVHENRSDGYAPGLEDLVSLWQNRFMFKSHKAFLLKDENVAKGMMGMQLPLKKGIITALYIAPQFFRNGYGKLLVAKAEEIVLENGGNSLVVEVQKHNFRALQFYKRLQFVETKVKFTHLIELKKELV